jgi:PAS domain S-box-containing protein
MQADNLNVDRFGEVFPHVENILHCGLYVYSIKNDESYWSQGMYNILGIQQGSIENNFENFSNFILPEDRDKVRLIVKKARENGSTYSVDFSILDGKGIYKRIHAETSIRTDSKGTITEYSGVMKDITESYFYKKALEQKILQLDKSNKNLQEFVYVASHDLQEPLRKISTFIERLKSRFEDVLGQEGNMYVSRILNSSNNMQTLLEDLLSFSRLSVNDKEFEMVSMKDCLNQVLSDLEIKIEESGASVRFDELPEIQAYPVQLKQLFSNLLSNGIKFKKQGQPPEIRITCGKARQEDYPDLSFTRGSNYFKITVEDNGIGFEQEFSERIFMIFQRLNGKSEFAGSGIGLSICKKIVENHHGFIFASGKPDQGATFTVLLPEKQY